jgi:hypothetical protein
MSELLIRAKAHYLDSLTQAEVDKMSKEQRQSYEARSQVGDIIVVRPDGHKWGKCECLPEYLVVKIPDSFEDAKYLEESLSDTTDREKPVLLKVRKHSLAISEVSAKSLEVKDLDEITPVSISKTNISAKVK